MNFFNLYPGDYLRDTTRLTLIEHGAYLRMMLAYYGEERPLPADENELFTIVCAVTRSDQAAVRKVADRYFPIAAEDGLRHNTRADEEILKGQHRIAVARENGAKRQRKNNPAGNPVGMPVGTRAGKPDATQWVAGSGTHPVTQPGVGVGARAFLVQEKELPTVAAVAAGGSDV